MLSRGADAVGRGWGFGIHEALDQVGAIAGPLLVSIILYFNGTYSQSFGVLIIPAILALIVVFLVMKRYPKPSNFESQTIKQSSIKDRSIKVQNTKVKRIPRLFWLYLIFVVMSVTGFASFPLISYHFQSLSILSSEQIPALYAVAMGVDALTALAMGRLFDKKGSIVLIMIPIFTIPITPLVFSSSFGGIIAGIVLWGVVLGIQETIMKAVISTMIPAERRGFVFGIFNAVYGIAWLFGSSLMGLLYTVSVSHIILFSVVLELIAIPLILIIVKKPGIIKI